MPPSADAYAPGQAALRTVAPSLLQQAVGVSIVATLAGAAAAGLLDNAPDALTDLGLNALGGWLGELSTRWFPAESDHAALAARIEAGLVQLVVAADVTELLARTDALATVLAGLHGQTEAQARLLQRLLDEVTGQRLTDERLHTATLQAVLMQTGAVIDTVRTGNTTLAAQLTDAVARTDRLIAAVRQRDAEVAAQLTAARAQVLQVHGDLVQGDQHHYDNRAPNQGFQGTAGSVIFNQQLPVTDLLRTIDPADARARLAALPTDRVPAVATLPPGSRMPLGSNPLFTGRDADLLRLAQALAAQRTSVVTAGIGGVGKTSLAAEFAHRYGHHFAGGVFWLSFAEAGAIPTEIAACGGTAGLRLPAFETLDFPSQVARVQAEWMLDTPRLLIFDNCEDPALVREYHPKTGGCRVLITSRNPQWEDTLGVQVQPLEVLSLTSSIALLRRFRPALTDAEATALAEAMGRLPLGLHLTGSFLRAYPRVTVADYLTQLDAVALDHPALQGRGAKDRPTDREMHLARAFALSYDRLQADDAIDALALGLLARAARFAPGELFPQELLLATLSVDASQELDRDDAVARLIKLGLLEEEADDTVRMHRLLCAYALTTAPGEGAQDAVEDAIIRAAYAVNDTGYPAAMQPLVAHLQHTTARAQGRMDERAATLLNNYAFYLQDIGAYAQAVSLLERALVISEQVLGTMHPLTVRGLNNLAGLYQAQGTYDRALPLLERALAISKQVLGIQDLDTAQSLNNLAELYRMQGAYERALPLFERALDIHEQVLGVTHSATATSLNNLGVLHKVQGAYDRALPLLKRALSIREEVLGVIHPHTATSLNNLAEVFKAQGAYDRALPLLERALSIREEVLGAGHPATAASLNNLAEVFKAQGAYDRALPLLERALTIYEQAFEAMHPLTAASLNNLAGLYMAQGAYTLAAPLYERSLAIYNQVLGAGHRETATSLHNLAVVFYYLQQYTEAHNMMVRAQTIREQVLGKHHSDTQASQQSIEAIRQRIVSTQRDPVDALAGLLDAIAGLAQGRPDIDRARVEEALDELQQRGFLLRDPVQRIWQGERDAAALTAGLDATDTRLIAAMLARLQGDE